MVYTFNDFAHYKEQNSVTDVVILDFAKAFDTVNRRKLILKLKSYGIGSQLILWIESYLAGRGQTVLVEGLSSVWCNILSCVSQGSVLGPLFLRYVNDLPKQLTSECRLFADDTLLYNTRENHQAWSNMWQLSFNTVLSFVG